MRIPVLSVSLDTRKLASFALVAFMVGGLLGGCLWNFGGVYVPAVSSADGFGYMKQFKGVDDLKEFLQGQNVVNLYWDMAAPGSVVRLSGKGFADTVAPADAAVQAAQAASEAVSAVASTAGEASSVHVSPDVSFVVSELTGASDGLEYSGTNVQVEGVDEGDIVKTDGDYIYLAKDTDVLIVKSYPAEEMAIVARIDTALPVQDIYVSGDKLVVFSYVPRFFHYDTALLEVTRDKERVQVTVYDVGDRASPVEDREFVIDGSYFNSRMIGDYVYFIVTNPAYVDEDIVVLPAIRDGQEWCMVEAEDVWHPNATRGWMQYHTITALNVQDPDAKVTAETFLLDGGTTIYVSTSNLYIIGYNWSDGSVITKIGIESGGIEFRGNGTVPGYVLNQFSMDEYKGYFRIATTSDDWRRGGGGNNVYVLDESMTVVGSLEGLAPGEEIYSARYMGDRCYLVTFKKVDPLFTIDLSDPENPRVLGKLKIPGFSNYLHPYDENTLIGVGKETEEAKEGDFAWHQGIKVSLFDVSDVENPREIAKIEIGDRGSDSPALYDHHAFLFSRARNLLVIPILEAQIDEDDFSGSVPDNFYGDYVYQGAYVFDISLEGIELRGKVTHIDDDSLLKSGFWFESDYEVERSLYIEDGLYTMSQGMLKVNDLGTLAEIASVELGEG
ncbi:beta-propeller domain-containing protein [Candidatus Bathyarchaeota archaeon]|nr:beta-propeller domain-containing protein [Candidatus Bathyarchaeota archaeon]